MTADDTLTLRQELALCKRAFQRTAADHGYLIAIAFMPLYPLLLLAAVRAVEASQRLPTDTEKVEAAKERDIEDWSELKSR